MLFFFDVLGVPALTFEAISGNNLNDADTANTTAPIDALVEFRAKIRANSIEETKSLSKLEKKAKSEGNEILLSTLSDLKRYPNEAMKLCDEVRDNTAPSIGIKIDDIGTGTSRWYKSG